MIDAQTKHRSTQMVIRVTHFIKFTATSRAPAHRGSVDVEKHFVELQWFSMIRQQWGPGSPQWRDAVTSSGQNMAGHQQQICICIFYVFYKMKDAPKVLFYIFICFVQGLFSWFGLLSSNEGKSYCATQNFVIFVIFAVIYVLLYYNVIKTAVLFLKDIISFWCRFIANGPNIRH